MEKKNDLYSNINEALDTKFEKHCPIQKTDSSEMISYEENNLDKDYNKVRNNLQELISQGKDAVQNILDVAKAGDSPRAYEVVATMIKTIADVNKDALDIHEKMKKIKEDKYSLTQKNTTNNTIYVGSTSELQDIINPERSGGKDIKKV
jgi:hypothetical protein